ncbi:MAG: endolytic transglycosylase MltG [Muribaculaceae bacterium]|nr:endolytic transglycosylase MltG [Muribaculaceae bacterium]
MNIKKGRKSLYIAAGAALVVLIALIWAYNTAFSGYEYEPTRVNIPRDADSHDVRTILTDALGKSFGAKVALMWRLQGGTPKSAHGSYLVERGTSALRVGRAMAKGRQTPVRFTFNNARFISDVASKAAAVLELDSAAFMAATDSVLSAKGFSAQEYPAAILPDTYEFYWTVSPATVVSTLANHRDSFWNEQRRAKARKIGLTPEQAHTLASIVEEESNRRDEHGKIARLYLNRLDKNMYLQSDPTVKFAAGDFALRRITSHRTKYPSLYNTYRNHGLPPGPIRIAEGTTIDSILDAPQHNYLYMCARPDFSGYHNFTETYDRHRINAALYHRALDEIGVKKGK